MNNFELMKKYRATNNNRYFNILLENNMGLIYNLTKKYYGPSGLDFEDALQEVILVFHKSLITFNLDKKNKLSTYFSTMVRNLFIKIIEINKRNNDKIIINSNITEKSKSEYTDNKEKENIDKSISNIISYLNSLPNWKTKERDILIFRMRMSGFTLQECASCFELTVESIRKINLKIKNKLKGKKEDLLLV